MSAHPTVSDLGHILVTGGAGFLGGSLARTLLEQGHRVRVFDLAPCSLEHPQLEAVQGNICDREALAAACEGIDTVFHTAAVIETRGGKACSPELRQKVYAINVDATDALLDVCRDKGVQRFVYTSSNSVVIGGQPLRGADETTPYTTRFAELYTETKVVAEQRVLAANGRGGLLTCAVRPSGIWGAGDRVMYLRALEQLAAGKFTALLGKGDALLDNSYICNLVHGQVLAAKHLVAGGTAPGQAYFINDGEPGNMMEFVRVLVEELGYPFPKRRAPFRPLWLTVAAWQWLHFRFGVAPPPLTPLALERVCIDNYFSIEKARRQLGYEPLYTTAEGMREAMPYYRQLHDEIRQAMASEEGYAASTF